MYFCSGQLTHFVSGVDNNHSGVEHNAVLADHFSFPGCVADLQRQLPLLDLFVLSSRTEALPNVLIEAQMAGVPIVSFDVGGVRETIIKGVTGLLTEHFRGQLSHCNSVAGHCLQSRYCDPALPTFPFF